MRKILYCIRHGTALHNKLYWTMGRKAYTHYHDTPLLKKGWEEAELLRKEWQKLNDIDLVVVSPLMRTLSTAETIFKDKNIPIVIYDGIKEYPQSGEWCNLRSSKSILMERFPSFDFSNLKTEHDTTWQRIRLTKGEELILLNTRICQFLKWIETRDEEKIAVVSHSSFLGQMMYGEMGDEKNELKHCHPYQFTLTI